LELASLGVLPDYQNKGTGSRLMKEMLLKEKRRPVFLLTSSDKEKYYKKFGADIMDPKALPPELKVEYDRIINLPFSKNMEVIAMQIV